jgi:NitT/TauT family transport system ATP-binding protein
MEQTTKDGTNYAITAEDIYVRYPVGRKGEKLVLNDIDLRIRLGEFVTMMGPSGCGKSTFLKLILGSERATSGQILIDGEDLDGVNRHRGIVFQRYSLNTSLTVLGNIMFGLLSERFNLIQGYFAPIINRQQYKEIRAKAFKMIDNIGLTKTDAYKFPYQLSGGMQQRVSIGQTIAMEPKPKVLLMDEPFGALDDDTRKRMQLFMLQLHKDVGITIVFVTHSLEEALFLGTRIVVMSQYYHTDISKDPTKQGSKIVLDKAIPSGKVDSDELKYQPEFTKLMEEVRHNGLDPKNLQSIREFDLSHPDAFRTVLKEEMGGQP